MNNIAQPLARYAAWRRAGDYVFLSGVIAVDPQAGKIVKGYGDIPSEAAQQIGQTGEFSTDYDRETMRVELEFAIRWSKKFRALNHKRFHIINLGFDQSMSAYNLNGCE